MAHGVHQLRHTLILVAGRRKLGLDIRDGGALLDCCQHLLDDCQCLVFALQKFVLGDEQFAIDVGSKVEGGEEGESEGVDVALEQVELVLVAGLWSTEPLFGTGT
jgi:hypothetical protein